LEEINSTNLWIRELSSFFRYFRNFSAEIGLKMGVSPSHNISLSIGWFLACLHPRLRWSL